LQPPSRAKSSFVADRAVVIADLGGGGAQRVVAQLTRAWSETGHAVVVITLAPAQAHTFDLDPRVRVVALDLAGASHHVLAAIIANMRRISRLRAALRASGAPVIVSFVGATNILTILASLGLGKRVIISERNDPARQSLGRAWDVLRRGLYRFADVVTANSRAALATLGGFVPAHKLALVPNPLPQLEAGNAVARERIVLAVGRLHRQKGFDVLLPAFATSRARHDGWRLVILGEGPRRVTLQRQAEQLGIADAVEFRGFDVDPFSWYRRAGLFVLPSRHEGMPNALLEAVAAGAPAIVSDACVGALDVLQAERSRLVFRSEDSDGLASAIDRLAEDAGLREEIAVAARAQVLQHHAPSAVMTAWEAVLSPLRDRASRLPLVGSVAP
jgi:GalNAc-alpha-(1->4)-GalNAc-alpha-(1->3)-diNAcBac-PP-undecaprenol alpha-1,4-N-acetyl-D-galactosaminyltransferase